MKLNLMFVVHLNLADDDILYLSSWFYCIVHIIHLQSVSKQ